TVPFYRYPEDAVKVAEHLNRYRLWRERPAGTTPAFKADAKKAHAIVEARRAGGGGYLGPAHPQAASRADGFSPVGRGGVRVNGDLAAAAKKLTFPVVLKVVGEKLVHKSDVGGVIVGIETSLDLDRARVTMGKSLKNAGVYGDATGYMVQEMVSEVTGNGDSR